MKLLVFLHGTTIMHRSAAGKSCEERVRQVVEGEASVRAYATYVPIGEAVSKLSARLHVIVVQEFAGIDLLPDDLTLLGQWGAPKDAQA